MNSVEPLMMHSGCRTLAISTAENDDAKNPNLASVLVVIATTL